MIAYLPTPLFFLKQETGRFVDIKKENNSQSYKSPPKKRRRTGEIQWKHKPNKIPK